MSANSTAHSSNSPPHQYINPARNSSKVLILPNLYSTKILKYQKNIIYICKYFRIFLSLLDRYPIVSLPATEFAIGFLSSFYFCAIGLWYSYFPGTLTSDSQWIQEAMKSSCPMLYGNWTGNHKQILPYRPAMMMFDKCIAIITPLSTHRQYQWVLVSMWVWARRGN